MNRDDLNRLADNLNLLAYIVSDDDTAGAAQEAAAALVAYIELATASGDERALSWIVRPPARMTP